MGLAYEQALDRPRRKVLPLLTLFKERRFYLAGGTGLALQLAHRRSEDFDFYTPQPFEPEELFRELLQRHRRAKLTRQAEGTLMVRLHEIECSAFRYPYPLVRPLVRDAWLAVASVEDIAAMKLAAIIQRGARRDYFDLYVLIARFGLKRLLGFARRKYPGFNDYVALQALTYFEDADHDPEEARLAPFVPITWSRIKRSLEGTVREFIRGG